MSRFSAFCLIIAVAATGFTACNASSDDVIEEQLPSSVLVKDFYISQDDDVLENLDKVFFSIDLNTLNIFNADSLPYGTDVHALIPKITTGGVSALEIVVPRGNQNDTTYNYLTNPTDSIDFTNGPVTLKLTSIDETVTVSYTVRVNVHKIKSDSLAWGDAAYSKLPTSLAGVTEQHTVRHDGKAYCLTTDGRNYCMAVAANPGEGSWQTSAVNFSFTPFVSTLRSTSDALYILADNHDLYKSTDGGINWSATSYTFDYLIGGYGSDLIGTVQNGSQWSIVTTSGDSRQAPADFPVSGMSVPIEYTFPMSDAHQFTVVGGRTATGDLTAASWGFDGKEWACLSDRKLPYPMENVMVAPYFIFSENDYFVATKSSIFVAFGGLLADGTCNDTTYISYNYGMSWSKASEEMQLPREVPAMQGAQALVFPKELSSRSAMSQWTPMATRPVPSSWMPVSGSLSGRASTEITSWECPYIYVFGGMNPDYELYDTVWRGVINRFTFKPIQ